jgi:oligopeptidase B
MFAKYGDLKFNMLLSRANEVIADAEHDRDCFYLIVNDKGANNRLVSVNIFDDKFGPEGIDLYKAKEVLSHHEEIFINEMFVFSRRYIITLIVNGLPEIGIYDKNFNLLHSFDFEEAAYCAEIVFTDYNDKSVRYEYSSLSCPTKVIEKDLISYKQVVLKNSFSPEHFDIEKFDVKRILAKSHDGVDIPISIIGKMDQLEPLPTLLYGYGSYGVSVEPCFRSSIIPLVERGFRFAIAHIRGGGDNGRKWYESAKMLTKKNTFKDFITCSKYLINEGYADDENLCIMGGSAGGMLMGVCMNMQPELYKAVIANVPFVDVINTMLDDSLPLTPGEYKEWGNPELHKEYFDYIASYCPYINVREASYPNLFVTAGLNDPRVGYWEAAKWVAKLRYMQRNLGGDAREILLRVNMDAGHGGNSGRDSRIDEISEQYAFLMHYCKDSFK